MISPNLPKREEFLRKKRNKRLLKYGLFLFLIIFIIALTSYISHKPQIRISNVELSGEVLVTQSEIEYKSLQYLSGSYLWLFPKNNAGWYPRKGLENYLKELFKRIDTVDIHLKDFETLSVIITEKKPFAIWCDDVGEPWQENTGTNKPKCYFMDQISTIFSEAPEFSGDAYFKYYGLVTEINPIGTEYIASTTEFSEISDFVGKVKKLGIQPQYIIAKDNAEFSLVLLGGGQIYFDTKESLSKIADNLEALLKTSELALNKSKILPVDYIDLRYGNKLFYKLKTNK